MTNIEKRILAVIVSEYPIEKEIIEDIYKTSKSFNNTIVVLNLALAFNVDPKEILDKNRPT